MKRLLSATAIMVALILVGLVKPAAHADMEPCIQMYELHTLDLVEVTVDGEPLPTLDEYEDRRFFLHTAVSIHRDWMFRVAHERQEDRMYLLRPDEEDEGGAP